MGKGLAGTCQLTVNWSKSAFLWLTINYEWGAQICDCDHNCGFL